jgi:hypothetical protein
LNVADLLLVLRFFLIVSPLPPMMVGTFVAVAVGASMVVVADVERTADALVPILTLQLFAAASGFAGPARRGYYDMLLTSADRRLTIGVVHWVISIGPGLLAWAWVAAVEAAVRRAFPGLALAAGSAAALTVVSTLAWACTVPLPRFAGAIGWMVTVVAAMSLWRLDRVFESGSAALMSVAALVNPVLLIGRPLNPDEVLAVAPALALGMAGVGAACVWIARTDYPLEASQ